MNKDLLGAFLSEEVTDRVRAFLIRKISACQSRTAIGQHKFAFNRFIITIDCKSRRAFIEHDLTPGEAGVSALSINEFIARLWS